MLKLVSLRTISKVTKRAPSTTDGNSSVLCRKELTVVINALEGIKSIKAQLSGKKISIEFSLVCIKI